MAATEQTIKQVNSLGNSEYKYGFSTELDEIKAPKGLSEEVVRFISAQKNEPDWMLEWRLNAFKVFYKLPKPNWAKLSIPEIDYQDYYYYSSPKSLKDKPKSLDEIDPEILKTYEKLGIPLKEQEILSGVAVDAVFDSVSVATTYKKQLNDLGIIFCSISEASDMEQKIIPRSLSCFLYVVATDTESKTASTATPESISCSLSGMPNFSYVLRISGSISSSDLGLSLRLLGEE
jgi:Fe-S cluster assembly protein SufB